MILVSGTVGLQKISGPQPKPIQLTAKTKYENINEKNYEGNLRKKANSQKITVDSSKPAVTRNGRRQKKSLRDFF